MIDYKVKYEEEKKLRKAVELELKNLKYNIGFDLYVESQVKTREDYYDLVRSIKPIKGLSEKQVDVLCQLLETAGYLKSGHGFYKMFEPYYKECFANNQLVDFSQTDWDGRQADLLSLFEELPITNSYYITLSTYVTIQGVKKSNTQFGNHRRKHTVGSKKIERVHRNFVRLTKA